jgi:hypothetical protein
MWGDEPPGRVARWLFSGLLLVLGLLLLWQGVTALSQPQEKNEPAGNTARPGFNTTPLPHPVEYDSYRLIRGE